MVVIEGRVLNYGELWFDEESEHRSDVDVLSYRIRSTPISGGHCTVFHSLTSDLTVPDEAIFSRFGRTNRYKIKRGETKDALHFEVVEDPEAALGEFCDYYDAFAQQKGLQRIYRRGTEALCREGRLALTCAARAGERFVWHAHVVAGTNVALLHSASHFRGSDNEERAMVGRANRWLHWKDMLHFKRMGATSYNWGGLFEDETVPEHAGVNAFKREFGGTPQIAYECEISLSLKGRIYSSTRRLIKRDTGKSTASVPVTTSISPPVR